MDEASTRPHLATCAAKRMETPSRISASTGVSYALKGLLMVGNGGNENPKSLSTRRRSRCCSRLARSFVRSGRTSSCLRTKTEPRAPRQIKEHYSTTNARSTSWAKERLASTQVYYTGHPPPDSCRDSSKRCRRTRSARSGKDTSRSQEHTPDEMDHDAGRRSASTSIASATPSRACVPKRPKIVVLRRWPIRSTASPRQPSTYRLASGSQARRCRRATMSGESRQNSRPDPPRRLGVG